jgi:hypothetical protein
LAWITKSIATILSLGLFIGWFNADTGGRVNLSVVALDPSPNYSRTQSANEFNELVDGNVYSFPVWTKAGAVGWWGKSPVDVTINIHAADLAARSAYKFRINASKGTFADADLAVRIDAYAQCHGSYRHVGAFSQGSGDRFADRSNHWMDIPLTAVGERMHLVMHSRRRGLFIDEIKLVPMDRPAAGRQQSDGKQTLKEGGIVAHSTRLLKSSYAAAADIGMPRVDHDAGTHAVNAWQIPCFGAWGRTSGDTTALTAGQTIEVETAAGLPAQVCLAVASDTAIAGAVTWEACDGVNVYTSQRMLTRSGRWVYDVLHPIAPGELTLAPGALGFLYIEFAAPDQSATQRITLAPESDAPFDLDIALGVHACPPGEGRLNAIVWSYSTNKPIWRNAPAVVNQLHRAGVDQFTVHPNLIPYPTANDDWDRRAERQFAEELALYRKKGQVLLVLRCPIVPSERGAGCIPIGRKERKRIEGWLRQLTAFMWRHGWDYDDWLLYPVDEINGKKFEYLKQLAPIVKQTDHNIRIYANPSNPRKGCITASDLEYLSAYIDQWQPSWDYVRYRERAFFQRLPASWWIYDNPKSPAKDSSPFADYRMLAWKAWSVGADGVGVWSFDDTQHSSAWDDFDGIRADWAMVYEPRSGDVPLSSRRWKAFVQGLADYRLLESAGEAVNDTLRDKILRDQLTRRDAKQFLHQLLHN